MKYENFKASKNYTKLYYALKDFGLSESYITKLRKDSSFLLLNNSPANMRSQVKENDDIAFALELGQSSTFQICEIPLDIVFEDEYLLVINKPAGLTCNPTKSHYDVNLAGAVCKYMQNKDKNFVYRIINRLDKDTSGLVIIAKNLFAYNKISNIDKTYEAICEGNLNCQACIIKPIYTENINGINTLKRTISKLGQEAITYVEPIANNDEFSHIRLKLKHGRTHQIRVHLSSINHPLIGDSIYGKASDLIDHTALVCKEISFNHPKDSSFLHLVAKYPFDFEKLLKQFSI